jgi:hypothetical protein
VQPPAPDCPLAGATYKEIQRMVIDKQQGAPAQDERLQAFGTSLAGTRDKWIRARAASGWDKRVAAEIDQYHEKDAANRMGANMMDSVEAGYPITTGSAKPHRSTVFVGITRQKTNASEARLSDILLPTDDRNWGIQPTPDAECTRALEVHDELIDPTTGKPVLFDPKGNVTLDEKIGKPATKSTVAKATQWIAHTAAQAMQTEIEDQLVECDYNSEVRKMLHDAAVTGTGVIKGPVVTKRTRKAWRESVDSTGQSVQMLEIIEELSPATMRVDPRMLWEDPACGDDVKNGQGIFELQNLTTRQVRDLAKQPGYLKPQLRAVVEEGPKRSAALNEVRQQIDDHNAEADKIFQHWIYWGELEQEDLEAAQVPVGGEADPLRSFCGCVEMINDTVVRAYMNPLEDAPIPYDFYPWEKVSGSCRGYGVPHLMRSQQSVVNAAWRQMMDNSGITAGPQIVVKQNAITPADGSWRLTPMKFWYAADDSVDVSRAFASFEFNSHQAELAGILEMAERLGDQETATPMMAQGQQGSAPETVGGMQLLMNSANVVLRRLVKQFDDYVTKPHIRRYYNYNMMYSEKENIKGDFSIDARGSSALIIRDVQNQAFTNLLSAASNPVFAPMIDARALFEKALQAQHIDPKDIMLTDEEVKAKQEASPPQPDPKIEAATISAQARVQQAQAVQQGVTAQVSARVEAETEDRKLRLQELQLQHDIEILKTSTSERISIEKVKAMLARVAIDDRTKKELAAAEMTYAQSNPRHQGI